MEILGEDSHPQGDDFKTYSEKVIQTCKIMENTLAGRGLEIISPSQNHLCLVKLPDEMDADGKHKFDSLKIQNELEKIGIICNRNVIPFDKRSPWRPSGLRLGTPALVSRGLDESMAKELGEIIADCIFGNGSIESLSDRSKDMVNRLLRF